MSMKTDYGDFTVVLTTLNEEETIGILIRKLLREYGGISIMVVDDGSRDGTKRVVAGISKGNGKVGFFDRAKAHRERGLTASAVDGILESRTRFSIVMDADLQHPTEAIQTMAQKLTKGCGLVVAIRAEVKGWELYRKVISKTLIGVGYFILVITGRSRCDDIFSGFFGVDRALFAKTYNANKGRFMGGGYKILYDFLKCTGNGELVIGQVPYSFGLRKHGASKAGFKQGILLFKSFFT